MKQLDLLPRHGGRRKGAGRPNMSGRQNHTKRAVIPTQTPVHVTLKLAENLPSLRGKAVFRCFRDAVRTARKRGFGAVHYALLGNHVHLIMEPKPGALSREIQSLAISFAKRLNALQKRQGAVFHDRYHFRALKTPTEVRNALAYALANEEKHKRGSLKGPLEIPISPFNSALRFDQWGPLFGNRVRLRPGLWAEQTIENWYDEILTPPTTWLLRTGWMRGQIRSGPSLDIPKRRE